MNNYKNVYIEGIKVSKPYFYVRNSLLHVKGNFDKCIELSQDEFENLKDLLNHFSYGAEEKQAVLYSFWQFCEKELGKPVIQDGLREIERRIRKQVKQDALSAVDKRLGKDK